MKQRYRLLVALVVMVALVFGCVPVALAGGVEDAGITLEEAIAVAKRFVKVPADYQKFQPGYSEGEEVFWELNWSRDDQQGGEVNARVNARTGELWGFHRWDAGPAPTKRGLPQLTRLEAQEKAQDFLKRVLPGYTGELQLVEDDSFPLVSLSDQREAVYSVRFNRIVNGIPFPENSASVDVDATTGEIRSFNLYWQRGLEFPKADGLLPIEDAKSLWRQNSRVELVYLLQGEGRKDAKPRLLFVIGQQELMIDARTGEIIKPDDYYYGDLAGGLGEEMAKDSGVEQKAPLTPAEQAALAELEKLVPKEKALSTARSLVEAPKGAELVESGLSEEYYTGRKVWYFNWRNKQTDEGLNARIDAVNGNLVSFHFYNPGPEQELEPAFSEAQALEAAKDFLNRAAKGFLAELEEPQVRPQSDRYPVVRGDSQQPKPTSYNINYRRLVKGVPFLGNGVELSYDACQGKIRSYQLNWIDLKFPEPQGAISKEQAEAVLLGKDNLQLTYQREYSNPYQAAGERPLRLVYMLDLSKAPVCVDAFTGTGFGYNFEPKDKSKQVFSDLTGDPYAKEIELLVKTRIIPVYEEKFHPQEQLLQRDFLIWLVRASGWPSTPAMTPDQEFEKAYRSAVELGILKTGEKYLPAEPLKKLTMAKLAVRAMRWEEVAQLSGIWSLPETTGELSPKDQGSVALAAGLGLLERSGKVDLDAVLSRADGALAIYQLLK